MFTSVGPSLSSPSYIIPDGSTSPFSLQFVNNLLGKPSISSHYLFQDKDLTHLSRMTFFLFFC